MNRPRIPTTLASKGRVKNQNSGPPPPNCPFHIGFCADQNIFRRRRMEDSHVIKYNFDEEEGQCLVAVFDGHGGDSAAKWCGENFGACLIEAMKEYQEDVREAFNAAYIAADSQLTADNDIYSGCTAATCLLRPKTTTNEFTLYSANCGDARSVLCRDGKPIRLTCDHKGSDPEEQKRVKEAGGFIVNDRVSGMLAITRALGDAELKEFISGSPYTAEINVDPTKDAFLIVACDGLWDVITDAACCEYVQAKLGQGIIDPDTISENLVDLAIKEGSSDNISVILVLFDFSGKKK